jgi:hypothetical protein
MESARRKQALSLTDPRTGITHYTIRPANDMPLDEYIDHMRKFLGVTRLPIEIALERGGRWAKN